ncbi:MAG: NosD domain-containing protein [Planctomycetota bacterium]
MRPQSHRRQKTRVQSFRSRRARRLRTLELLEQRHLLAVDLLYPNDLPYLDGADLTLQADTNGGNFLRLFDGATEVSSVELVNSGDVEVNITRDPEIARLVGDTLRIDLSTLNQISSFVTGNGGELTLNFIGGFEDPTNILADDQVYLEQAGTIDFDLLVNSSANIVVDGSTNANFGAFDLTVESEDNILMDGGSLSATELSLIARSTQTGQVEADDLTEVFALPAPSIQLSGGSLTGQNVTVSAVADVDITVETTDLLDGSISVGEVFVMADTAVTVDAVATVSAAGQASILATNNITTSIVRAPQDDGDSGDDDKQEDAAISASVITSDAEILIDGQAVITAADLQIVADNNVNTATTADGQLGSSSAGGTLSTAVVLGDTNVQIIGSPVLTANTGNLIVDARSNRTVNTTAIATTEGATDDGNSSTQTNGQQTLSSNNAQTSDGDLTLAAAITVATVSGVTNTTIGGGTLRAPQGEVLLDSSATQNVSSVADSSVTSGDSGTGVGIGAVITVVDFESKTDLGGGTFDSPAVRGRSRMPMGTLQSEAKSGPSGDANGADVGVAGALTVHTVITNAQSVLSGSLTSDHVGADFELSAESLQASSAKAIPKKDGGSGESLGVGASVGIHVSDRTTRAAIDGAGGLTNVADVSLSATSDHDVTTQTTGAAAGGTAIAAVVSNLVHNDDTLAQVATAGTPLSVSGDFSAAATSSGDVSTAAEGNAQGGSNAAIGAAITVSVVNRKTETFVDRDLSASGALSLDAISTGTNDASAIANASGEKKESENNSNVDQKAASQRSVADSTASQNSARTSTNSDPSRDNSTPTSSTDESDGPIAVAAAITVNVVDTQNRVRVGDNVDLVSGGIMTFSTAANADAVANSDGQSVDAGAVGIGAAVAINRNRLDNEILFGTSVSVTGLGMTASVAMRDVDSDRKHRSAASAVSGAGADDIGIAGAVAIHLVDTRSHVLLPGDLNATLSGGDLNVSADSTTESVATAMPADFATSGGDLGIGASVALNRTGHITHAEIADGATINGTVGDVSVLANGLYQTTTDAANGSKSDIAISPVVALALVDHDTTARIGTGPQLTATGDLMLQAQHVSAVNTTVDSDAEASNIGIGASVSINLVEEDAVAGLARPVVVSGTASVLSSMDLAGNSEANASVGGNDQSSDDADTQSNDTVNNNPNRGSDKSVPKAQDGTNQADSEATSEANNSESGTIGVAAAVAIHSVTASNRALVGSGANITASGAVSVVASAEVDSIAEAIGSAVTVEETNSVGAAVGVNSTTMFNEASVASTVVGADVQLIADTTDQETNDQVVYGLAAGASTGDVGAAGSVAVNIVDLTSRAQLTGSGHVRAAGDFTVQSESDNQVQTIAAAAGLGGTVAIGASVAVTLFDVDNDAAIDGDADANGSMLVDSTTTVQPRSTTIGDFGSVNVTSVAASGAGTDGEAAVAATVVANLFDLSTVASIAAGSQINQHASTVGSSSQSVSVLASSDVDTFSIAGSLGVSLSGVGVGVGLDLGIIDLETRASIGASATVDAQSNVAVDAILTEDHTTGATNAGIGNSVGVAGSASVYIINTNTTALVDSSAVIDAGGNVQVLAAGDLKLVTIGGSIGVGGTAGVGLSNTTLVHNDSVIARVGDFAEVETRGSTGLQVNARSTEDIVGTAIAGSAAGTVALSGSAGVYVLNETTQASIGQSTTIVADNGSASGLPNVEVTAFDSTMLVSVAGSLAVAGTAGAGFGADVVTLNKTTTATIGTNADVVVEGNLQVLADSIEDLTSVAAGIAAAGTVAIGVDAAVHVIDINTLATIGNNAKVTVDGSANIAADSDTEIDKVVGVFAAASGVGLAAAAAVNTLTKNTQAIVGDGAVLSVNGNGTGVEARTGQFTITTESALVGSQGIEAKGGVSLDADSGSLAAEGEVGLPTEDQNAQKQHATDESLEGQRVVTPVTDPMFHGLAVTATNRDDIESYTISAGFGTVGIAISAGVNVANITTHSGLGAGAVVNSDLTDANAEQSVRIASGSDFQHVAIAAGFAGGFGAVAPVAGVTVLTNQTTADLGAASVQAIGDVEVVTHACQDILLVGFGAAGGAVGVGGTVDVLTINSTSLATIAQNAVVLAHDDVIVWATDDTDFDIFTGSAAAGLGGVGISVGVVLVDKVTAATIHDGAQVDALALAPDDFSQALDGENTDGNFGTFESGGIVVQAESSETFAHLGVAAGAGFVGVAGAVTVTLIDSDTTAQVGAAAMLNQGAHTHGAQQNVVVAARNWVDALSFTGGITAGAVAAAGAVDIGSIKNDTRALVSGGAEIDAQQDAHIHAVSAKNLRGLTVSGSAGAVALAAAVSTWSVGTSIDSNYEDDQGQTGKATEGEGGSEADREAASKAEVQSSEVSSQLGQVDTGGGNNDRIQTATQQASNSVAMGSPTQDAILAKLAALAETPGTSATVESTAVIDVGRDLQVSADENAIVNITIGSAAAGLVGFGASVAVTSIAANASAVAGGNLSAGGDIGIHAELVEEVSVTSLGLTAGAIALGAAVAVVNDTSVVQAHLSDGAFVRGANTLSITASNQQTLGGATAQAAEGLVGVGASFAQVNLENNSAIETLASIGDNVTIGVDNNLAIGLADDFDTPGSSLSLVFNKSVDNVLVSATSNVDAIADTTGVAGGIVGATANFTDTDLRPEVVTRIGNSTSIQANNVVELAPQLTLNGKADTTGVSVAAASVGASVSNVRAGAGDDVEEALARIGSGSSIQARTLRMEPRISTTLLADSLASASGASGVSASIADTHTDLASVSEIGANTTVEVHNLAVNALHLQDIDAIADSLTIGLFGAGLTQASNLNLSRAAVDFAAGVQVDARDVDIYTSNNLLKGSDALNYNTVEAISVGFSTMELSGSESEIGTSDQAFESSVTFGNGSRITVADDSSDDLRFSVRASTDWQLADAVVTTGVSVTFGGAYAKSSIEVLANSRIEANGATLENENGDLLLSTSSGGTNSASSDVTMAAGLTGAAVSNATAFTQADQQIDLNNSTLRGNNVNLLSGRNGSQLPNRHISKSVGELFAASFLMSFSLPISNATTIENNTIDIRGTTEVLAFKDVNLVTDETIAGDDRTNAGGGVFSLSLIPHDAPPVGDSLFAANSIVNIDPSAHIEAGTQSRSLLAIGSIDHPNPAFADLVLTKNYGDLLSSDDKAALGLPIDLEYEYVEPSLDQILLPVQSGFIFEVVEGFGTNGQIGDHYQFNVNLAGSFPLDPTQFDFSAPVWIHRGRLSQAELQEELELGNPTYRSDATAQLTDAVSGEFFVVKPVEMDNVGLIQANYGLDLFQQRQQIIDWIINHADNAEAVTRYQVQLNEIENQLRVLGLVDESGAVAKFRQDLDLLILQVPKMRAAPGAVFIESSTQNAAAFQPLVDNQAIIARPGANIDIANQTPLAMNIVDVHVSDNRRLVTSPDGTYFVLEGGNVYFNNAPLTNVVDGTGRQISIVQDSEASLAIHDLDGYQPPSADLQQDLFINGRVVNEAGGVFIQNVEGGIRVRGEIRGEPLDILAAGDFTLHTDSWFHTNRDPRQYLTYDAFRNIAAETRTHFTSSDGSIVDQNQSGEVSTLTEAIEDDASRILSQGTITITARFLNVNGLIQSGVESVEFDVAADFTPPDSRTSFTTVGLQGETRYGLDDTGSLIGVLPGVSFGTDGVPIDGYWDPNEQAFVLEAIRPEGGEIVIVGELISTGNGRLKAASGFVDVDINNESPYRLILNRIDTTKERKGRIEVVNSSNQTKVEYEVVSGQIQETHSNGTLVEGNPITGEISTIFYQEVSTETHAFGDPIQYELPSGLHYVWVDGVDRRLLTVKTYRKESLEIPFIGAGSTLLFLADELDDDEFPPVSENVFPIQDEPKLESETIEIEGATADNGEPLVPAYANGAAYSVAFERYDQFAVTINHGALVRHPPTSAGTVYRYLGPEAAYELDTVDYSQTDLWENSGQSGSEFVHKPEENRFDSSFKNVTRVYANTGCEGGGWFQTETCTYTLDETSVVSDFYTHTLKADYPIDIEITPGSLAPEIKIHSVGGILFQDHMYSPDSATVELRSAVGDIRTAERVALFGPSPTVVAGGQVDLTIEGQQGPLNVSAAGDIEVHAVSEDNQTSSLEVDLISTFGDVFLNAPNGVQGTDSDALVQGTRIEIQARLGSVTGGPGNLTIDSGDTGGVAILADGDVMVSERMGDMRLVEPVHFDSDASIQSISGDVWITMQDGSLIDGIDELNVSITKFDFGSQSVSVQNFYNIVAAERGWPVSVFDRSLSPGLYQFLFPHGETLGVNHAFSAPERNNIDANNVVLFALAEDNDIGTVLQPQVIDNPGNFGALSFDQQRVLSDASVNDIVGVHYDLYRYIGASQNVDLDAEDYGNTARWEPISVDYRTGAEDTGISLATLSTGDTVLVQFDSVAYGVYEYVGPPRLTNLIAENYNSTNRWRRITPDHVSSDGTLDLNPGAVVADQHAVDSLTVKLVQDIDFVATGNLTVTAHDSAALSSNEQINVFRAITGGDLRLKSGGDLLDVATLSDAAVASGGRTELLASNRILGLAGPFRTQIAGTGRLDANAVAAMHILQVSDDAVINSDSVEISNLLVSSANSNGLVRIVVEEGDLIAGRIVSADSIELIADGSILDAFNDVGAEVVNVWTNNPSEPPSGDVFLQAGSQIGTADNPLDLQLDLGGLTTASVDHQFLHSVATINLADVTSTAGDATITVEGAANVFVINTLAGTTSLTASGQIVDSETDAASDINALNVELISTEQSIGSQLNDVEIDTASGGWLRASAANDINVHEVSESLTVLLAESTESGYVRLSLEETTATGEDLIVDPNGLIHVNDGALILNVPDDLSIAGSVHAPRSFIHGDYRNRDPQGTQITITGNLTGGPVAIRTDDDDDVVDASGATANLHIQTFAGNDNVIGGGGRDLIDGGLGTDTLAGGPNDDVLYAGFGIGNQLSGGEGNDRLFGSDDGQESDPDFFDSNPLGDVLRGEEGDDQIWALGGADLVFGGPGNDWIDAGVGSDHVEGGQGDDQIFAGRGLANHLFGNEGDDTIWGSHVGDDVIDGGAGNDDINAQAGDDTIDGGSGHDRIDGGPGIDIVRGGDGDDELRGGGGAGDQLFGEAGDDLLIGSDDGADSIFGGPGDDRARGRGGNDTIEGGPGNDFLEGDDGDDTLSGDAGSDVIVGGANHDILYALNVAGSGADSAVDYLYGDFATGTLDVGAGQDQLFGDSGIDLLFGEGGDDLIDDDLSQPGIPQPAASLDRIDYGSDESADPTDFVPPTPTSDPNVLPPGVGLVTGNASLPSGVNDFGRWAELSGSATKGGVSGDSGWSSEPNLALSGQGTLVTWTDTRHGNHEVFVALNDGTQWQELSGSAGLGGISDSDSRSSQPSIATDASDRPVVAWTETTASGNDILVAYYDATAAGGDGAWLPLAGSNDPGGISQSGNATKPTLLQTAYGTMVAWTEHVAGTDQAYARFFDGSAWIELSGSASGGGLTQAVTGSEIRDITITENGAAVAVAWTAVDSSGIRQVYLREFDGTAWNEIEGSATNGVSAVILDSLPATVTHHSKPSVAYHSGNLWVSWIAVSDNGEVIVTVEYDGQVDQPHLRQTRTELGELRGVQLAAAGGELWQSLVIDDFTESSSRLYATRWDGTAFVGELLADEQQLGIHPQVTTASELSVGVDAGGQLHLAWQDLSSSVPEVFLRSNTHPSGTTFYASDLPGSSVQEILDNNDLSRGDVIVVTESLVGDINITPDDAGVLIVADPLVRLTGNVSINADQVVLQRLDIIGEVRFAATTQSALRDSVVFGSVQVDGGSDVQVTGNTIIADGGNALVLTGDTTDLQVRANTISDSAIGIAIGDPASLLPGGTLDATIRDNQLRNNLTGIWLGTNASGRVFGNEVGGGTTGLLIQESFIGSIDNNQFHDSQVGIQYDAAAAVGENEVNGNQIGIVANVDSLTEGLGFVGTLGGNTIHGNQVGVQSNGRVVRQRIQQNDVGVSGIGILGGESLGDANIIANNTTGVSDFIGTIQFNTITRNEIGISASAHQQIIHNVVSRNVDSGILVPGADNVSVYGNTIHSTSGDNLRIVDGATRVELLNNIFWAEGGYNVFVANDSQVGFFSDYNLLHADGSGRLVHWIETANGITLDFVDVLDWQRDVAKFDQNSIGTTVLNPQWSKPRFGNAYFDDYSIDPLLSGLRLTSPTLQSGSPLSVPDWQRFTPNRLANPSFESGASAWTTSNGAGTQSAAPPAADGGSYFAAGSVGVGFAEQTLTLGDLQLSESEADAGDFTLAFGGRIRVATETEPDRGTIRLTFLNGSGGVLSTHPVVANNVDDRWELIGDRVEVPTGTRSVVYRFEASRESGTTADAFLDEAFLFVLPEDVAIGQGAYGDQGLGMPQSRPTIALRSPDLYVDVLRDTPTEIRWDTFANAGNLPVRIELLQDTAFGPVVHSVISSGTPDDGSFLWTPAGDAIDYGTYGWRIQVSLVGDSFVLDRSTETFAVP